MAEVQISRNSRFELGSERKNGSRKQTVVFSIQNLKGVNVNQPKRQTNHSINNKSVVQNKYYLRLDSPQTNQAMITLGLDYDNFKQKTIDDFGGDNVDPEVQQMRYEHYLKLLANDVSAVLAKRKQLIEIQMKKKGVLNLQEDMFEEKLSRNNSKILNQQHFPLSTKRGGIKQSLALQGQLKLIKQAHLTQSQKILKPQDFQKIMRQTTSYLHMSHKNPETEFLNQGADYLEIDLEENEDKIKSQIQLELEKYNYKKKQKQLQAKQDYNIEIQRFEEMLRIKEKEEKIQENIIRQEIEEFKAKEKKRQDAIDKLEKINNQGQQQKKLQQHKRKQIQQKIQKQAALNDMKAQQLKQIQQEKQRWREQQNWKIQSFLIQKELNQEQETYENMENLQLKQQNADYQYKINMNDKIRNLREATQKDFQKALYSQQFKESQENEKLQKIMHKMENKEEDWKLRQMDLIRKEKEQFDRKQLQNERFLEVQQKNKQNARLEQGDYKKRAENVQKKLEEKQRIEEREQYLKNQKKMLMEETRHKKQIQLEKQQNFVKNSILEKERARSQQIEYFKNQRKFLQDTKKLISHELKQEEQRIFGNLSQAQKTLFPWKSYQTPKSQIYLDKPTIKKGLNTLSQVLPINSLETRILEKPVEEKDKSEQQNMF